MQNNMVFFLRCFNNHGIVTRDRERVKCYCGESFQSRGPLDKVESLLTCKVCNNLAKVHFNEAMNNRLIEAETCFNCDFWQEKVMWREQKDPNSFVVNGVHYRVQPDVSYTGLGVGHGGAKFIIKPLDESRAEIVTHNLWCQGDIPAHFRDKLTDNAIFL
jgi:hypothetical protein